jgi:hypothetical protein
MKRAIVLTGLFFVALSTSAQFLNPQEDRGVPAYNAAPPKPGQKLQPIMEPGPGFQYPFQVHAYQIAAKIPRTLYQLPCYCYCDRTQGHNSLHTCFATEHGAHCETCMQELFYANQMLKQGKTAKQIRDGIEKGEWKKIDVQKM